MRRAENSKREDRYSIEVYSGKNQVYIEIKSDEKTADRLVLQFSRQEARHLIELIENQLLGHIELPETAS